MSNVQVSRRARPPFLNSTVHNAGKKDYDSSCSQCWGDEFQVIEQKFDFRFWRESRSAVSWMSFISDSPTAAVSIVARLTRAANRENAAKLWKYVPRQLLQK